MKISYSAVVLHNPSVNRILSNPQVMEYLKDDNLKIFCHHMTIKLGSLENTIHENRLGNRESLIATKIGKTSDGGAIALLVQGNGTISDNKTPHITLAVNPAVGGQPKDSSKITEWEDLEEPIVISGTVREIPFEPIQERNTFDQIVNNILSKTKR